MCFEPAELLPSHPNDTLHAGLSKAGLWSKLETLISGFSIVFWRWILVRCRWDNRVDFKGCREETEGGGDGGGRIEAKEAKHRKTEKILYLYNRQMSAKKSGKQGKKEQKCVILLSYFHLSAPSSEHVPQAPTRRYRSWIHPSQTQSWQESNGSSQPEPHLRTHT